LYRLARFETQQTTDAAHLARAEALLRRAIAANSAFAPAHSFLADVLTSEDKAAEAVEFARRGALLDQSDVSARLTLARALWAAGRTSDARGQALAARALADRELERAAAQDLLDTFDRSVPAGATRAQ
jgi:predicted Zn-dependent protease